VTEFISELEALDQPVAELFVRRLTLVTGEPFAQALYSIAEGDWVELHSARLASLSGV